MQRCCVARASCWGPPSTRRAPLLGGAVSRGQGTGQCSAPRRQTKEEVQTRRRRGGAPPGVVPVGAIVPLIQLVKWGLTELETANASKQQQRRGPNHSYILAYVNIAAFVLLQLVLQAQQAAPSAAATTTAVATAAAASNGLHLNLVRPGWWQFLTSAFVHNSVQQLAQNLFLITIFGRTLELSLGSAMVWAVYIASGLGSAALSAYVLSKKAAVAASASALSAAPAAAFGLFAAGFLLPLLTKRFQEVALLAPFVVLSALAAYAPLQGTYVVWGAKLGHLVPLAGALAAAGALRGAAELYLAYRAYVDSKKRKSKGGITLPKELNDVVSKVVDIATDGKGGSSSSSSSSGKKKSAGGSSAGSSSDGGDSETVEEFAKWAIKRFLGTLR